MVTLISEVKPMVKNAGEWFSEAKEAFESGDKITAFSCVNGGVLSLFSQKTEGMSPKAFNQDATGEEETEEETEGEQSVPAKASDPTKPIHKAKRSYKQAAMEASGGQLPKEQSLSDMSFVDLCDRISTQSKLQGSTKDWVTMLIPMIQQVLMKLFETE